MASEALDAHEYHAFAPYLPSCTHVYGVKLHNYRTLLRSFGRFGP